MFQIVLNGESRPLARGASVLDLLAELGLEPDRVAVELNAEILRKREWDREIPPGAHLEIVQFVGGG